MNIKEQLSLGQTKNQISKITNEISDNPEAFETLLALFKSDDLRLRQRASNILLQLVQTHPQIINPYVPIFCQLLSLNMHVSIRRNSLRLLQFTELPEEELGFLAEKCFNYLHDIKEPPAVKAFAMTVLYKICLLEPDLSHELKITLEDMIPYGAPAIKSRGSKILQLISKMA